MRRKYIWRYKFEEKIYLGVRECKMFSITDLRCFEVMLFTETKDLHARDFRLPPRCKRDLCSSGMLCSVDW